MKKLYENNFVDSNFDINTFVEKWPDDLDQNDIVKWKNLKQANMIFIPVFRDPKDENKEIISKKYFFCSKCKQWKKLLNQLRT